jgi:DNA-binding CsgD family transcriptional regulator
MRNGRSTVLGRADYRDALRYTEEAALVGEPTQFTSVLLRGLLDLVGGDGATLTHLDLRTGDEVVVQWPPLNPAALRRYPEVAATHPLRPPVRARLRGRQLLVRPLRISDVLTAREWRSSPLHALTHGDVSDQVTMPVAMSGTTVRAVALSRQRGRFTERQVDMLELTRIHVGAALGRTPVGHALGLKLSPEVGWTPLATAPGLSTPRTSTRPTRAVPGVDLEQLSEREWSVAALVAGGHTDQQIARQLGLAPATVSSHLRRIYRRLGLSNRAGLAAAWIARHAGTPGTPSRTAEPIRETTRARR